MPGSDGSFPQVATGLGSSMSSSAPKLRRSSSISNSIEEGFRLRSSSALREETLETEEEGVLFMEERFERDMEGERLPKGEMVEEAVGEAGEPEKAVLRRRREGVRTFWKEDRMVREREMDWSKTGEGRSGRATRSSCIE